MTWAAIYERQFQHMGKLMSPTRNSPTSTLQVIAPRIKHNSKVLFIIVIFLEDIDELVRYYCRYLPVICR